MAREAGPPGPSTALPARRVRSLAPAPPPTRAPCNRSGDGRHPVAPVDVIGPVDKAPPARPVGAGKQAIPILLRREPRHQPCNGRPDFFQEIAVLRIPPVGMHAEQPMRAEIGQERVSFRAGTGYGAVAILNPRPLQETFARDRSSPNAW